MQATALGRYLLYGPDGPMPAGPVERDRGHLRAGAGGGLGAGDVAGNCGSSACPPASNSALARRPAHAGRLGRARWRFEPTQGCSRFPEVRGERHRPAAEGLEPDRQGARIPGRSHPPRRLRFPRRALPLRPAVEPLRRHGRAGGLRRPLPQRGRRGGRELPQHRQPDGTHSPQGWPSFAGWPRDESQTHEGTYWKWIERAWRCGLRLMVNDLVENRALCELYPYKQNNCNEMVSAYKQAEDMRALQDYIDAQFGGPGKGFFRLVSSSAEARRVINGGKLAVVLGIEVSEVLNCGQFIGTPNAPRPRSTASSTALRGRRPVAVPGAQVRQRAGRYAVRQRGRGRAGQHGEQVRDRRVLDRRPLRRPGSRQRAHARPARPQSSCPRCSGLSSFGRCFRARCRSILPDRTATRRASPPSAGT